LQWNTSEKLARFKLSDYLKRTEILGHKPVREAVIMEFEASKEIAAEEVETVIREVSIYNHFWQLNFSTTHLRFSWIENFIRKARFLRTL
jgi:hypothetical protein